MKKDELILKDFLEKIPDINIENIYLNLYSEYNENFQKIFAYLHQQFNSTFEHLNYKNGTNKHYNAEPSRELMFLINGLEDLSYGLKGTENEITFDENYQKIINICKTFLQGSGGSPIPEDFEKIQIIKYEPIFKLINKIISIPNAIQNNSLDVIGEGAFSLVKKYKDQYYRKYFAIKQAKNNLTERELQRFKREFEILSGLSFPYILEVYNYDHEKNSYVMEYCDFTLNDYISKNNQTLSFKNRKKLALQFLYGINYLHKKKLLHRDLSFKNILLKIYDYSSAIVKLSDFGLIKEEVSDFTKTDTEMKGTIIDPSLDGFKNYSIPNEIYAVGFILQFIFTGKKNLQVSNDALSKIIIKCTDRDVDKRYKNINSIIDDVDMLQQ